MFTGDLERGLAFAEQARAGWVNINASTNLWESHLPFGGRSGSVSGRGRVGGRFAMEAFTEPKTILYPGPGSADRTQRQSPAGKLPSPRARLSGQSPAAASVPAPGSADRAQRAASVPTPGSAGRAQWAGLSGQAQWIASVPGPRRGTRRHGIRHHRDQHHGDQHHGTCGRTGRPGAGP